MFKKKAIIIAAGFLYPIVAANAQDAAVTPAPSDSSEPAIEEIIVTAQRHAQNIQDVPISMQAVKAEDLTNAGVTNLKDLSAVTSGLNVTDSNGFVFPIIRGIGSFIQGSSSNSSIATYLDGAYIPRMTSTAIELDNIQSVEVLKGPQSTLYGRNATGGAINIITQTTHPDAPLSGRISYTQGSFDQRRASFFVEKGLGQMFGINASGFWVRRDGYVTNLASSNEDAVVGATPPAEAKCGVKLDSLCEFGGSVKLTFKPMDKLEISLAARASEYNDTASSPVRQLNPVAAGAALQQYSAYLGGLLGVPGGYLFGPGPYTFATDYGTSYGWSNRRKGSDRGATLTGEYRMDDVTITSISTYNRAGSRTSTDLLSASMPTLGFNGVEPTKNFGEELHALSSYSGRVNWLAGLNYFDEKSASLTELDNITASVPTLNTSDTSDDAAIAGFGELYVKITDRLKATGGLRYTQEQVKATAVADPLEAPGTLLKNKTEALTYRGVLDYHTDLGMLYGSVSTGFKAGGINATNLTGGPFKPEKITTYELGQKFELFDRRLRLNSAFFYNDFKGIQGQLVGGPTGGAQYFVNGNKAKDVGLETDFNTRLTEDLSLWGGVTYLIERKYTDFNIPANPETETPALDVTGNKLVGAPEWSTVIGAKYQHSLAQYGTATLNVNITENSGYFVTLENNIGTGGLNSAKAVTLLNARLEYTHPSGAGLALWGRNLTSQKYVRGGLSALGGATALGLDGQPLELGVTASYNYY